MAVPRITEFLKKLEAVTPGDASLPTARASRATLVDLPDNPTPEQRIIHNDAVSAFKDSLRAIPCRSAIHAIAKDEREYLMRQSKSFHTRRLWFAQYLNAVSIDRFDPVRFMVYDYLSMSSIEYTTVRQAANEKIERDMTTCKEITDPAGIVAMAEQLVLHGPSYYARALGAAVATGRRSCEIGTGDFQLPESGDDTLLFSGQAKTKGIETRGPMNEVPTLISARSVLVGIKVVQDRVADIRAMPGNNDTEMKIQRAKFDARANSKMGDRAPKLFGPFVAEGVRVTPHQLRAIYINLLYWQLDDDSITFNAFASKILGHQRGDTTTANSYADYYVALT